MAQVAKQVDTSLVPQPSQQQQDQQHDQQVLMLEVQDRFGCLFLDFKGNSRACFMFGVVKQLSAALRGVLLGLFIGRLP